MRLIALISWFDESPGWLAAVVAGAGQFCDGVVCVDGGYRLYPGARARSMPEQTEAILWAAEAANLDCIIHRPGDVWHGGEVQKRNQTLALAGTLCEDDQDFICILDADMHLMRSNREAIHKTLYDTKCDVATMTILEGKDMLADDDLRRLSQNEFMALDHEWTQKHRLIYRYHHSMRYGPKHWWLTRKKGRKVEWLWGPSEMVAETPAVDMLGNLVCYHRSESRGWVRRNAAKQYYQTRDALDAEAGDTNDAVTGHSVKRASALDIKSVLR